MNPIFIVFAASGVAGAAYFAARWLWRQERLRIPASTLLRGVGAGWLAGILVGWLVGYLSQNSMGARAAVLLGAVMGLVAYGLAAVVTLRASGHADAHWMRVGLLGFLHLAIVVATPLAGVFAVYWLFAG